MIVTMLLMPAFNRLNGIIAGINIETTTFVPAPRKIPVKIRLRGIIITVIAIEPKNKPIVRDLILKLPFLYIAAATISKVKEEIKCIRKPIQPLDALNVRACIRHTESRVIVPAAGPKSIEPINTGTSAMSYSRNGAEGMRGTRTR